MVSGADSVPGEVLARLGALRQHQQGGRRSPHKPLLVLLALGRLSTRGSSDLPWAEAHTQLADLIAEFGPASGTSCAQSAAYPFTRLRSDGIWTLDHNVPMDTIGPLTATNAVGRFELESRAKLRDGGVNLLLVEKHPSQRIVSFRAAWRDGDKFFECRPHQSEWKVALIGQGT